MLKHTKLKSILVIFLFFLFCVYANILTFSPTAEGATVVDEIDAFSTGSGGTSPPETTQLETTYAKLKIVDVEGPESVEVGEEFTIGVSLENSGNGTALDVTVDINFDQSRLSCDELVKNIGTIDAGKEESVNWDLTALSLPVGSSGESVNIWIEFDSSNGGKGGKSVNVAIEPSLGFGGFGGNMLLFGAIGIALIAVVGVVFVALRARTSTQVHKEYDSFSTVGRGELMSMKLDWAELKGEGGKLHEFARAFVNELIAHNLKCKEIPGNANEIILKIKTHPFLKGKFHAMQQDGNLYYNAFLKHNHATFMGVMGLLAVVGFLFGSYFASGPFEGILPYFFALAFPVWWFFIAGGILGASNKPKTAALPLALKVAEAEIRSI